jgi:peptide/nickel transport system substrate-binding protein
MVTMRSLRLLAPVLVLALVAASCSSDDEPERLGAADTTEASGGSEETPADFNQARFEGEPQEGGSIVVGVRYGFGTLDPAGLSELSQHTAGLAVYDPLVGRDEAGDYLPSLATDWSISDDLDTYTLTLRDDVVFQDGAPFDATAVVAHFERLADPATNCSCVQRIAHIGSVEAPDPTTVVFSLTQPDAFFLSELAGTIGLVVSPKAAATHGADYPAHPVGTGPFSLESFDPVVLKRNPDYWQRDDEGRPLPYLDEIGIREIPDHADRLESLRSGEVDLIQTDDRASIVDAASDEQLQVQRIIGSSATLLAFNTEEPPFDDVRARWAVAHGLDRQALDDAVYEGESLPAEVPIPVGARYHADVDWPELDLDRAGKLIADLEADGMSAAVTATCIDTSDARAALRSIRRQAQAFGLSIESELMDAGPFVNLAFGPDHDFDAVCFKSPYVVDANGLYESFHSEGTANVSDYRNPTVDEALDDIRRTADPDEHVRLLGIVQEELARDVPVIPLVHDLTANVYDDDISGLPVPDYGLLGVIELTTLYRTA